MPDLIFLLGPTASGKTGLAVDLVQQLNAEIVSVDSAMVYRDMDIGTAKPDADTLRAAPHALIDIRDAAHAYSAADFRADALREIEHIRSAGRIPLLTGGTSLYFRALEYGLSDMPGRDDAVRARLTAEAEATSWQQLHVRLAAVDSHSAARIHPNDAQRIQRALEIYELTGTPLSVLHRKQNQQRLPWSIARIVVAPACRATLHARIERRFDQMMQAGFVEEVEKLKRRPELNVELPSMRAVGYRQIWQMLDGEMKPKEAVERAVFASRQLAKRQLTWLRSLSDAHWLESGTKNIDAAAMQIIRSAVNE
ncbi:MAG: tRNA (adenosine(37)-N6)-dimethylallyltransferase MiaA [Salinisphaera sp.]|jgi:tRNA dimethylallyltransferase|nr:tRNA (adenosine(37)-N6)-dimethylallyltransferase MiaA [Salinisphaera sp.]